MNVRVHARVFVCVFVSVCVCTCQTKRGDHAGTDDPYDPFRKGGTPRGVPVPAHQ